jgi:hypothetical protein
VGGGVTLPELISEVADALSPLADEIPDLNIYPGWSDVPTPPALDIYPANPFQTGAGFRAGNNQIFLTVRARVAMNDPAAGQQLLLRMLDPEDPASVEVALEDVAAVTEGGVSGFTQYADDAPVNERMLGCEWRVTTFL